MTQRRLAETLDWKEEKIKELKKHISEREEWLEERERFSMKLRQWNDADRKKIEELQESQKKEIRST